MKILSFAYTESALLPENSHRALAQKLIPEIEHINRKTNQGYETPYAFLNLINDEHMHTYIANVVHEKKTLNPRIMIVIGIGGSNLGARAVHEALHGVLYNETNPELKVYWADTVDAEYIGSIISIMENTLQSSHTVLLTIVSKSGSTPETAANTLILLNILKHYHPQDYARFVIAITDKNSSLWNTAIAEKFVALEIPKMVGGRYSVFSPCGLFPLAMLGVNIQELLEGARFITPALLDTVSEKNPAAQSAIALTHAHANGKAIHDSFLFSVHLESMGKWYRQLMAESIGKEYNRLGEQVFIGITPTVSIGSIDLHSLGQLYMGGPRDKITTFITINTVNNDRAVPSNPEYVALCPSIQSKTTATIMNAIITGIKKAYLKQSIPFMSIELPELSAFYIGQLLQCKMLEIVYLGYLLDVNPFDQPQVELYKEETRKILDHE